MRIYDLWVASAKMSNRAKIAILKSFKSTEELWQHVFYDDRPILQCDKGDKLKLDLKKAWDKKKLEDIISKSIREGIKIVSFNESSYPLKLKNYEDSPALIFYKGNIEKLNKNLNISIVGSRNCSVYGRNVAELISKEVSMNNINVISGMARGIDTYAHKSCIEKGGYTCAVLGSGIDVVYPKENRKLYDIISENGCVLSEFVLGTQPFSYNFPNRNRIISGLSDIVIVVEADEKSGSLITATIALEQGKDVMAVPGSIFSNQSKGTNKLIRDGAYPFTNFQDLFSILNIEYGEKIDKKNHSLSSLEKKLCKAIGDTPIHIDDIYRITNIDIKRLYELLFELQLKDEIICLAGNYYVKVESKEKITVQY